MNINFAPIDQAFIDEKIACGEFVNADEVVSAAMHKLREFENEAMSELLLELEKGEKSYQEGRFIEYTPSLINEVMNAAIENIKSGIVPKSAVCPKP